MATETAVLRVTNVSGTSFIINVSGLALSSDLTTKDFEVTHASVVVTSLYTKISQTQIQYTGANITLGTVVQIKRETPLSFTETTFFSLTTAVQLTNSLTKLKRRVDEVEAWAQSLVASVLQGGITLGTSPVFNEAYPGTYSGDVARAATRDNLFSIINRIDNGINTWAGTYNYTAAAAVNAALATQVTVPTLAGTDSSTKASSTAQTQSALDNRLRLLVNRSTISPGITTGAFADLPLNNEVLDRDNAYNPATFTWVVPSTGIYKIDMYSLPISNGGTNPTRVGATAVYSLNGTDIQIGGSQWDSNFAHALGSTTVSLVAGQSVKPRIFIETSGGVGFTMTIGSASNIAYMAVYKLT